jgi:hypothetical protein
MMSTFLSIWHCWHIFTTNFTFFVLLCHKYLLQILTNVFCPPKCPKSSCIWIISPFFPLVYAQITFLNEAFDLASDNSLFFSLFSCTLQDQLCPVVCLHATISCKLHPSRCHCPLYLSNIFPPHKNLCEPSHSQIQVILELPIPTPISIICHSTEVSFFLVLVSH